MDPLGRSQPFRLDGRTDRAQQLGHISLLDAADNSFVGMNAGSAVSGERNTSVGANSLATSSAVNDMTLVGAAAGERAQDSSQSVGVGAGALRYASNLVGVTAVGHGAGGISTRSSYNTSVGWKSQGRALSGSKNTTVGALSGLYIVNSNDNTFVGESSGRNNRYGSRNVFVGAEAGRNDIAGANNVYVGFRAGMDASGGDNVAIGSVLTTPGDAAEQSVVIGANIGAGGAAVSNSVVVGSDLVPNSTVSESLVLGHGIWSTDDTVTDVVALGKQFPIDSSDAGKIVVGFDGVRVLVANSTSIELGGNNAFVLANIDAFSVGFGNSRYFFANSTTITLGPGGNTETTYFYADATSSWIGGLNKFFIANTDAISLGPSSDQRYFFANTDTLWIKSGNRSVVYADEGTLRLGNAVLMDTTRLSLSNCVYAGNNVIIIGPNAAPVVYASGTQLQIGEVLYADPSVFRLRTALGGNVVYADPYKLQIGDGTNMPLYADASRFHIRNGTANIFYSNGSAIQIGNDATPALYADSSRFHIRNGTANVLFANGNAIQIGNDATPALYADSSRFHLRSGTANVLFANASTFLIGNGTNQVLYVDPNRLQLRKGTSNVLYANSTLFKVGDGSEQVLSFAPNLAIIGNAFYPFVVFDNASMLRNQSFITGNAFGLALQLGTSYSNGSRIDLVPGAVNLSCAGDSKNTRFRIEGLYGPTFYVTNEDRIVANCILRIENASIGLKPCIKFDNYLAPNKLILWDDEGDIDPCKGPYANMYSFGVSGATLMYNTGYNHQFNVQGTQVVRMNATLLSVGVDTSITGQTTIGGVLQLKNGIAGANSLWVSGGNSGFLQYSDTNGNPLVSFGRGSAFSGTITVNQLATGFSGTMLNLKANITGSGFNFMVCSANNVGAAYNVQRIRGDGVTYGVGAFQTSGADYAEFFEWKDGNPDAKDYVGSTVVLDGAKVVLANAAGVGNVSPLVIGAVSVNPTVVGDSAWSYWNGRFERDEFGRPFKTWKKVVSWIDEEGKRIMKNLSEANDAPANANVEEVEVMIESKQFKKDEKYVPREERKEWACIGMVGKMRIRKGQPIGDRWIFLRDISANVAEYLVR